MNLLDSVTRQPRARRERPRLLIVCLLVSLGLHCAAAFLLFSLNPEPSPDPLDNQPTMVRLVTPPETPSAERAAPEDEASPEFELDPLPATPPPDEPVRSKRKAERDQRVEQEQAPAGDDVRDQLQGPVTPRPAPPAVPQARPEPTPPQTTPDAPADDVSSTPEPADPSPVQTDPAPSKSPSMSVDQPLPSEPPPPEQQAAPAIPRPPETPPAVVDQPTLKTTPRPASPEPAPELSPEELWPDPGTLARIAGGGTNSDRNRTKEREDVEIGDTVWLNLQHNLLVSFFRRFHDRVERVWNYPREAAENGIEGTLEMLIIVDREGELVDVYPTRSSGSDILDFEAIQAVYRAAPFGPLTRHYPHEQLKIRANFRYSIIGRAIYGR